MEANGGYRIESRLARMRCAVEQIRLPRIEAR
jgi:hypothetical protein